MSLHFVIDGYNLIKQAPFLDKASLEESRKALISLLSVYQPHGSKRNRITVVFDGKADSFSLAGSDSLVRVVFTRGESADDEIKRMLEEEQNPRNIVVVTNDGEIRRFARQNNAQVKSVEEFLAKCSAPKPKGAPDDKIIGPHATAKIDQELKKIWLK